MKKLFCRISNELSLVLTALILPSFTGLWAGGWTLASTVTGYLCGVALCVLGGRGMKTVERKRTFIYALCIILPMALLVILDQRTPVDFLVNMILALVCVWIGYRTRK